jgi:D-alanine-D-alanine ligase
MRSLRIGLCYDLADKHLPQSGDPPDKAAELDSMETVSGLREALASLGHDAFLIGDGRELLHYIVEEKPVDLIFNIAEGLRGRSREAQAPALLEMMGIPYTGADPLTLALCLDKGMFKRVMKAEGIPTPDSQEILSPQQIHGLKTPLPAFVKPAAEGSGKGIRSDSRVASDAELQEIALRTGITYGWPILIEEYLPGAEITVGIVGNGDARCLGAMEIEFLSGSGGIYSYATKQDYLKLVKYHVPPRLPESTIRQVQDLALKTYHLTGCRDFGRVDLRLDAAGNPKVLEINPLAGLNPVSSDLIIMAKAQGNSYRTVIADILEAAINRTPSLRS